MFKIILTIFLFYIKELQTTNIAKCIFDINS